MTPDMINSNVPAIRPGKLRASELNESDAIIVDGECRLYVTRRAVEPFAILTDEQLEQLWRRHPVTPEMIDAADAVGSADGLLWPICALSFVLAVALSAVFS